MIRFPTPMETLKWRVRLALVACLSVAAGACGGTATDTTSATTGASTTTAAGTGTTAGEATTTGGASKEPVTITLWVNREQYLPLPGYYEALAADYPNITVEAELVPDDDLFFQLIRMAEADEPLPDLVQLDDYFAIPLFDAGLQIPLDDFVAEWEAEDPEGFAAVSPNAFFTNEEGAIVGITPVATMDVIYYRSDWLAEAGVTEPIESWQGLLEAARALKATMPDILPFALPSNRGSGVNWFLSMLAASGVEFEGSVPQLTSEAGLAVINFLQTLIREDLTTIESLAWGDDESRGAWIGGQAAITYDSVRSVNDLGGTLIESGVEYPDGWSTVQSPIKLTDDGEDVGTRLLGTRTYHITAASEHPAEAGIALRYLLKPERAFEMLDASLIPLQREVLESQEFTELQPFIPQPQIDAVLTASQRPADSKFFQVIEVLEQVVQDAFEDREQTPEALAEKWQAELDALEG